MIKTDKVFMFILISLFFLGIIPASTVRAKTVKSVNVKLTEAYNQCVFDITVKGGGKYDVFLYAPKKGESGEDREVYKCSPIDEKLFRKSLSKTDVGTWKVLVKAKRGKVGKVKVNVTAEENASSDIVDDISVGKDIAGLKLFMADRNLNVTWEDETVGNVNITVSNVDDAEELDKTSVEGRNYTLPIPENVKKVRVSVVPATSDGIKNAARNFTIKTNHVFKAKVEYTNREAINTSNTVVPLLLEKNGYSVQVFVNKVQVLDQKNVEKGEYNINIPIDDIGKNEVVIYVIDKDGNRKSFKKRLIKDVTPPNVKYSQNYDGMILQNGKFKIEGKIKDYVTFKVNDKDISVANDGHFSYVIDVHDGSNDYSFIAMDDAGNEAKYDVHITGGAKQKRNNRGFLYLGLIAIILILYFGKKKKQQKADEKDVLKKAEKRHSKSSVLSKKDQNIKLGKEQSVVKSQKTKKEQGDEAMLAAENNPKKIRVHRLSDESKEN